MAGWKTAAKWVGASVGVVALTIGGFWVAGSHLSRVDARARAKHDARRRDVDARGQTCASLWSRHQDAKWSPEIQKTLKQKARRRGCAWVKG